MSGVVQSLIKSVNWQDPSKFKIHFTGAGASKINLPEHILTIACKGISLADVTTAPIEGYIAEEWRFAVGRLESYQISITFLDFNNYTLYRKFSKAIQDFVREYPDSQKFNIDIYTTDNFTPNDLKPVISFRDCMLVGIQAPMLDNSAVASISEFTVSIKCSYSKIF